jgi:hypothetical protein
VSYYILIKIKNKKFKKKKGIKRNLELSWKTKDKNQMPDRHYYI